MATLYTVSVQIKMASSEVSEVLYSEDDICLAGGLDCVQEVVTDSAFPAGLDTHQIIYGDQLIVTSEDVPQSEEIVGGGCVVSEDPLAGLYDSVPVPAALQPSDDDLRKLVRKSRQHQAGDSVSSHHRKQQSTTIVKSEELFDDFDSSPNNEPTKSFRTSHGTWQQKQVSIKTLEGEFSVTMWASGADDGKQQRVVRIFKQRCYF